MTHDCTKHSGIVAEINSLKELSNLRDEENESALMNLKETMERNQDNNNKRFDRIEHSIDNLPEKICDKIDTRIDEKIENNNSKQELKLWLKIFGGAGGIVSLFWGVIKILEYYGGN